MKISINEELNEEIHEEINPVEKDVYKSEMDTVLHLFNEMSVV